jgi:hypothetical protein
MKAVIDESNEDESVARIFSGRCGRFCASALRFSAARFEFASDRR